MPTDHLVNGTSTSRTRWIAGGLRGSFRTSFVGGLFVSYGGSESTIIAALIHRPEEVSPEALSLGVAMATAGYDLPMARLDLAPLVGGWSVATAYDWADPGDPKDLYRGVSLGKLEGTVRFFRPSELPGLIEPRSGARPLFPVAELLSSNLADPRRLALIALSDDGTSLYRVTQASAERAGPTLSELLRCLSLGFRARSAFEEELIQALDAPGRGSRSELKLTPRCTTWAGCGSVGGATAGVRRPGRGSRRSAR